MRSRTSRPCRPPPCSGWRPRSSGEAGGGPCIPARPAGRGASSCTRRPPWRGCCRWSAASAGPPGCCAVVAEVTVAVGGVRIGFVTREPDVAAAVADRYADFLSPGPTDWRFEARRREEGLVPLTDVVVREGDRGRLTIERHDFLATLDLAARAGTVALGAVDHVAVDAFLRVVCSLALLDVDALLVHAASLGRGGVARAFVGPSGSGKTTLARLSPDATLL